MGGRENTLLGNEEGEGGRDCTFKLTRILYSLAEGVTSRRAAVNATAFSSAPKRARVSGIASPCQNKAINMITRHPRGSAADCPKSKVTK